MVIFLKKAVFIFALFLSLTGMSGCSEIKKADDLVGLSESALERKLGSPSREQVFTVTKDSRLHEYQSDLYALLNTDKASQITVKEKLWKESGKTTVAWLTLENEVWITKDTLIWSDSVRF